MYSKVDHGFDVVTAIFARPEMADFALTHVFPATPVQSAMTSRRRITP
jgi:hypothetical protein